MKNADAVCVLSDFESWSLVISEAKLVGTPVIATRTSGAIEQIEDGETGVLCDFTPEAIADGIERLLKDAALQSRIRKALEGFSTQQRSVQEFTQMLTDCPVHRARPSLLYVSDNINYVSGRAARDGDAGAGAAPGFRHHRVQHGGARRAQPPDCLRACRLWICRPAAA